MLKPRRMREKGYWQSDSEIAEQREKQHATDHFSLLCYADVTAAT
jgi:hypothetical protein